MSIIYSDPASGIELERPLPDYYNDELLEKPETIYRIDDRGTRWYYSLDGNNHPTFYGSVTHIKSSVTPIPRPIIDKEIQLGTKDFRSYLNNRRAFGTLFHMEAARAAIDGFYDFDQLQNRIDYFASGYQAKDIQAWKKRLASKLGEYESEALIFDIVRSISKPPVEYTEGRFGKYSWHYEAMRGLMAWLEFIRDYEVTFLAVELSLAHPDGFANTIDYYLERNKNKYTEKTPKKNRKRIREILDIKTGGIYDGNEIQLHFNERSFKYHYPTLKVDRLSNWTYRENSTTTPYYCKNQTDKCSREELDAYLNIWKQKSWGKPRDITVLNGTVKAGESAMERYQTIPVEEFIKQKHESINQ